MAVRNGGPPKTLADAAYARLRQEIIEGRFAAGARLRVEHLSEEYELGATPLREALSRLAAERLVDVIGQRGFRVAPMSLAELDDITEMRVLLEARAVEASVKHGGLDWEAQVVATHHAIARLDTHFKAGDTSFFAEYEIRNAEFHDALVAACGSKKLLEMRGVLFDQHRRYRFMALAERDPQRNIPKEHRLIVAAALERNAERANKLISTHIRATAVTLRKQLAERLPEQDSAAE